MPIAVLPSVGSRPTVSAGLLTSQYSRTRRWDYCDDHSNGCTVAARGRSWPSTSFHDMRLLCAEAALRHGFAHSGCAARMCSIGFAALPAPKRDLSPDSLSLALSCWIRWQPLRCRCCTGADARGAQLRSGKRGGRRALRPDARAVSVLQEHPRQRCACAAPIRVRPHAVYLHMPPCNAIC